MVLEQHFLNSGREDALGDVLVLESWLVAIPPEEGPDADVLDPQGELEDFCLNAFVHVSVLIKQVKTVPDIAPFFKVSAQ